MEAKLQERAEEYARVLTEKYHTQWDHGQRTVFCVQEHTKNQKYVRIVEDYGDGSGRSVHAFISTETGGVHKTGGWSSPQRDRSGKVYPARYNLLDDQSFADLLHNCEFSTGYLYSTYKIKPAPVEKTIDDVIREIEEATV